VEGMEEEGEEEDSSGRFRSPFWYCFNNFPKERRERKRTRVEIDERIAMEEVKARESENSKV
jgi:hypothetical protein